MINEKEQCTQYEEGYKVNEEKCQLCSENCSDCYFSEGKEKYIACKEGFGLIKGSKCYDCKIIYENCKSSIFL